MNITAAVMAHPKRAAAANSLETQLKKYPFSDVGIVWDQRNSEWDTGLRSLRFGVGKGEWHLVIQDDAVLTPYFYQNIEGAIKALSTKALISLYTGTVKPYGRRVKQAVDKATYSSWLRHYMLLWGVAILIPSDHIEPMLDFVKDHTESRYDTRIAIFYQRNMLPVYYTMPSLVDHNEDLGSLLNHQQTEPRVAHKLADRVIRWNKEVIDI